ncbi:hypothetical protein ACF09K_09595 [Streptomyces sp. NPDC014882]|uniref:hypothetical protein n=1 Tax=Streptomyces sp. NPDC014882 TaxID=3364927 RepID=UPI0036F4F444
MADKILPYAPGPHSYLDWGEEVVVLAPRMTESPTAVVFDDTLYCLYRGTDGCLWYTTFDGLDWGGATKVDPEVGVTESPAAVVYQDKLFCLHQGAANDGWLWCTSFDGAKWESDKATHYGMSKSPGAVVYRNNILVVRQGRGEVGTTWWGYRDPGGYWLEDQQMADVGTTAGPALVVHPGSPEKVYCLHRGSGGSHDIWLTSFDGTSWTKDVKVMSDDAVSGSPAVLRLT